MSGTLQTLQDATLALPDTLFNTTPSEPTYEIAHFVLIFGLLTITGLRVASQYTDRINGLSDHQYYPLVIGLEIFISILSFRMGDTILGFLWALLALINILLMLFRFGPPGLSFSLKSILPRWAR